MPESPSIVLVVDDDISVRESLELLLRHEGFDVETFVSAQEFLGRPPVTVPSCLLLDISLPGLNGLDLQKLVAVERHEMPIIFITGHGDIPITVQAMKAGAQEFLTKPFSDEILLNAVRTCLDTQQGITRPLRRDPGFESQVLVPQPSRTRGDGVSGRRLAE